MLPMASRSISAMTAAKTADTIRAPMLTLMPSDTNAFRQQVLAAFHERCSLRGVCRIFGISRQTLMTWLKKSRHSSFSGKAPCPPEPEDVLEIVELWSFVLRHKQKRRVWLTQCRRTRQVVTYAIGGRGQKTCRLLWRRVPPAYKKCLLFTDFWRAYAKVLPAVQHRATGKGDGQTCHPNKASCGAFQQHSEAAYGAFCAQDAFVFQDRPDARGVPAVVLARV